MAEDTSAKETGRQIPVELMRENSRASKRRWPGRVGRHQLQTLRTITQEYELSIDKGHLVLLDGNWYISHGGLLAIAHRRGCESIEVTPVESFCDPTAGRWTFKAIVYKTGEERGFAGFGDANPSNVSPLVRGAELRMAETRAVNRALRKGFGIGLCSLEELGSKQGPPEPAEPVRKQAAECGANGNGFHLRDRLLVLIRQQKLDGVLVKAYAADFCGVSQLRDASKQKIEQFIAHLSEYAAQDRAGLLCRLNSYPRDKESAA